MERRIKFALSGAAVGLVISAALMRLQDCEVLFILSGPPYYLDSITIQSGTLVGYPCFLYYASIFALLGYVIGVGLPKRMMLGIVVAIILTHGTLVHLASQYLFGGVFETLHEISKHGIRIE